MWAPELWSLKFEVQSLKSKLLKSEVQCCKSKEIWSLLSKVWSAKTEVQNPTSVGRGLPEVNSKSKIQSLKSRTEIQSFKSEVWPKLEIQSLSEVWSPKSDGWIRSLSEGLNLKSEIQN